MIFTTRCAPAWKWAAMGVLGGLLSAGAVTPRDAQAQTADASNKSEQSAAAPAAGGEAQAAGGAAALSPAAIGEDGATYTVRVRDLESRVDALKEQIRRSHTKLALLSDTVSGARAGTARATITLQNKMSGSYKLVRALVLLDGAVQYKRQDESGALASQKEIPIYSGNLPAGEHLVTVALNFQGKAAGVFQYVKGYRFEQRSTHALQVADGQQYELTAIAYEKGNATTAYEERPSIRWDAKQLSAGPQRPAASASGAATDKGSAQAAGAAVSASAGGGK